MEVKGGVVERNVDFLLLSDAELVTQCEVDCYRASGPGGQKRNKTSSAVRLRHKPTGLIAISEEDRSQHVNKARALRRLRRTIALSLRREVDPATYERSGMLERYISGSGRLGVNARNPEYPLVVREVFDVLGACELKVSDAADMLELSTAQLIAFLQRDPHLWQKANQLRAEANLQPLRSTNRS
jgi:hypothetical protein